MKNRILAVVAGVALLGVGIFIGSVGTRAARAEGAGALVDGRMAAMHAGMMGAMMNGSGMMDGMM